MSTKLVKYRDSKVIKNGTATVVYGISDFVVDPELVDDVRRDLYGLEATVLESKGVAKLNPADSYDEEVGRRVASKRAERQGNRAAKKQVLQAIEDLGELLSQLQFAADELDYRFDCLKKDAE